MSALVLTLVVFAGGTESVITGSVLAAFNLSDLLSVPRRVYLTGIQALARDQAR